MGDPREEVDTIFRAIGAFFNSPAVKAAYAAEAKRNAKIQAKEDARIAAAKAACEEEARKAKAYDRWVESGGSSECMRFGMNDGCKPHCPVFMRGECEMQAENEAIFAEEASHG